MATMTLKYRGLKQSQIVNVNKGFGRIKRKMTILMTFAITFFLLLYHNFLGLQKQQSITFGILITQDIGQILRKSRENTNRSVATETTMSTIYVK